MKKETKTKQNQPKKKVSETETIMFPDTFPFWARLKISKNRTTLVIDETEVLNKKTKKLEEGFVHREATSKYHKGFEEIKPNPDKDKRKKKEPMYLKSPRKHPKRLLKPHNKKLDMPNNLKERYAKNNNKTKKE